MFDKSSFSSFFNKDLGDRLLGGVKGVARILDEPVIQAGITAFAPELAVPLGVAKSTGLLEKLKNA